MCSSRGCTGRGFLLPGRNQLCWNVFSISYSKQERTVALHVWHPVGRWSNKLPKTTRFCCFSIFFIYWICRFIKGMVWDCCWLHSSSSLCSDLCTNIIWRFKCLVSGSSWPGTGWHTPLSCWFSKMWRIYLHKFVTTKLLRTDDDANFRKILWRFYDLKLRQSCDHRCGIITLS